jgi:hypothetical protein
MFGAGSRLLNRQPRSPVIPFSNMAGMAGWKEQPKSPSPWHLSRQLVGNRRRQYWVIFVVILVIVLLLIHPATVLTKKIPPPPQPKIVGWEYPPSLTKLKQWERNLPQHNLDLPFPEGRTGRYVKFSNQVQRLGWNNAFNEMCVFLSYVTYTWTNYSLD